MALAATGRYDAARRMLDAMRAFSRGSDTIAPVVGDIALPIGEAVLAHRQGKYSRAVELMRPVLDDMHRLGGSHAQHDVLNQLFAGAGFLIVRGFGLSNSLSTFNLHRHCFPFAGTPIRFRRRESPAQWSVIPKQR